MSVRIDIDESSEMSDPEPLLLRLRQEQGAILGEIVHQEDEDKLYEQTTVWLDTINVHLDTSVTSRMTCIEKEFQAVPDDLSFAVESQPDGVLVEVVSEDTVVCFYRIRYGGWGLVFGASDGEIFLD